MEFISTEDFALKQGELFKEDGQPQRIKLICNYANLMKHELKIENLDSSSKECLFEGFEIEKVSNYEDELQFEISIPNNMEFLLIYYPKKGVFIDCNLEETSLYTVKELFFYLCGFAVEDKIHLTRYCIRNFNL